MENSNNEIDMDSQWKEEEKGLQRKYSRSEMEALRFAQPEYQLQMFQRVYWGLQPKTRRDFDGISVVDSKQDKNDRNRSKNKQRGRNVGGGGFHQEMLMPGMIFSPILFVFFFF